MSTLTINQPPRPVLESAIQTSEIGITQSVQQLDVTVNEHTSSITETVMQLNVTQNTPSLDVYFTTAALELFPDSIVYQNFGAGVADQDTILGTGNNHDPYRAPDMLRITRRLSEFDTQTARHEARDNLGLNIIDGGTFL